MTSTASTTNQNPATTTNAPAASYASAAGANTKPTSPLIATGSQTPVVVGSTSTSQNASQQQPLNGGGTTTVTVTPAVPSAAPPVARGSSIVNGGSNHGHTSSVTISAPASHIANGGPVGNHKNIQFGFPSPQGTPHMAGAVPIPITGSGNHRIPSPAHSPSPIPQVPQQSGGQRAPNMSQVPPPTFGSFPGDNDRHLRQHPGANQAPHLRHDSPASGHGDGVSHGGHGRGGYQGQGRGRGGFNTSQFNAPPMGGYAQSRNFSGANAGRGGMYHPQGRGGMQQYPSSPQPPRASPAGTPTMAHGTPVIPPATIPAPHAQPFYPPLYSQMQVPNPYAIGPMDGYRMNYPAYGPPQPMNPYLGQPPQFPPAGPQPFVAPYASAQPAAPPMSRNASQVSGQPATTPQAQPPVIASSTPLQRSTQPAQPAIVSSTSNFSRPPKKSAAVVIKNPDGSVLDFSQVKGQTQAKTPPVVSSTPTPPPKASTPSHARTESVTTSGKTAEQVRNEFKNAVQTKVESSEAKAKEEEAAKAAAEKAAAEKAAAEEAAAEEAAKKAAEEQAKAQAEAKAQEEAEAKAKAEAEAKAKAEAEARAREEAEAKAKAEAEAKAQAEAEAKAKAEAEARAKAEAEAEARAKEEAEAKAREEAESKAKAEAEVKAKAEDDEKTEAPKPAGAPKDPNEMTEEELERMIREMEEEDARREREQEEISARKKKEAEEAKRREEEEKAKKAAEMDRKLREMEREMERLEEEKERRRKEAEAKGEVVSVRELLGKTKNAEESKVSSEKDKGAAEKASSSIPAEPEKASTSKPGARKPAALNLAPLKTASVEAPQPSAALQSLRSARFLPGIVQDIYPPGIKSPNPALNEAVQKKGRIFKYDVQFLLQFQNVFTEKPSPDFDQQVKALIGDSDSSRSGSARTPGGAGRQGSRGPSSAFPPGGAMGQFGAKTLPPGTTSEQRFAMSQGSLPRPGMGTMGGAFNRPSAFPGNLSRTPSSGPGGLPSPRTGSRRGGSRAKVSEAQAAKTMPLTQGQEIKPITISATGWKPMSIGNKTVQNPTAVINAGGHLDPEMVQRKVKAALNKMTPENFDRISEQILTIASQSKDESDGRTLRQVIQLTFEKACDEAHWASMYAKFCKRMLDSMSPEIRDENLLDKNGNVVCGGALFRKYLLNRCQEEFERGWKVDLPKNGKGEVDLMSDEYYAAAAAKRKGLGLVQFIGELYKLTMLTERIMHECVRKLLEFQDMPDEAEIESLCKLLRTIGGNLDAHERGKQLMDAYFTRINAIIELPGLPSRLKFMLMDIVDLRKANWVSKDANKGPKTLEEVRAEAEAQAAQKAAETARNASRSGPGGRPAGGRSDSRNTSYSNTATNVGMDDLRRLKGSSSRTGSNNPSFGPTSMFNSRSNSGRRMGGPGGAFGRAGEDSGTSSRTGTPPVSNRESVAHANAFGLLADTGDHPASPPSTHASPALSKATLDTVAAGDVKKE